MGGTFCTQMFHLYSISGLCPMRSMYIEVAAYELRPCLELAIRRTMTATSFGFGSIVRNGSENEFSIMSRRLMRLNVKAQAPHFGVAKSDRLALIFLSASNSPPFIRSITILAHRIELCSEVSTSTS